MYREIEDYARKLTKDLHITEKSCTFADGF